MKASLALALLFGTFATSISSYAAACIPVKSLGLCANIAFVTSPVENQNAPFALSFTKLAADGTGAGPNILPDHKFNVDLFMPDMGHGSSPVKVMTDAANSTFQVDEVYFVMSGEWAVRVKFVAVNGIPLEMISIPVTVGTIGHAMPAFE